MTGKRSAEHTELGQDAGLHRRSLAQYSAARKADPTLESVTVPLDRGLEVSVVLR